MCSATVAMLAEVEVDHTLDLSERRVEFRPRHSTVWTRRQQAVCVRRAFKHYGTKKIPHVVLDGLNMTVPKGAMWVPAVTKICSNGSAVRCLTARHFIQNEGCNRAHGDTEYAPATTYKKICSIKVREHKKHFALVLKFSNLRNFFVCGLFIV
jgi:hypothetical protein